MAILLAMADLPDPSPQACSTGSQALKIILTPLRPQ